jgi:hypothetical protein
MKVAGYLGVLLIGIILICGCMMMPDSKDADNTSGTDLTGNWSGVVSEYIEGKGSQDVRGESMTMNIDNQEGRVFSGTLEFTNQSGYTRTTAFQGALDEGHYLFILVLADGTDGGGQINGPAEMEVFVQFEGRHYSGNLVRGTGNG